MIGVSSERRVGQFDVISTAIATSSIIVARRETSAGQQFDVPMNLICFERKIPQDSLAEPHCRHDVMTAEMTSAPAHDGHSDRMTLRSRGGGCPRNGTPSIADLDVTRFNSARQVGGRGLVGARRAGSLVVDEVQVSSAAPRAITWS